MPHFKNVSSLFLFATLLVFSSCKTTSISTVSSDIDGPTVIQKPVVADLEVKEVRVSGTATTKGSMSEDQLKKMAVADALKKSNGDVLIEPRYEITASFRNTTVNVTGYPATYKNFRSMEAQDTIFVNRQGINTTRVERKDVRKNKRAKKIAAWTTGGVVGAVGIFLLAIFFI